MTTAYRFDGHLSAVSLAEDGTYLYPSISWPLPLVASAAQPPFKCASIHTYIYVQAQVNQITFVCLLSRVKSRVIWNHGTTLPSVPACFFSFHLWQFHRSQRITHSIHRIDLESLKSPQRTNSYRSAASLIRTEETTWSCRAVAMASGTSDSRGPSK